MKVQTTSETTTTCCLCGDHQRWDVLGRHKLSALAVCWQVLEVFSSLPDLRCLYLKGNPMVSKVRNYRKTMIATIPSLTYLDDRPVFVVERRCAEAW